MEKNRGGTEMRIFRQETVERIPWKLGLWRCDWGTTQALRMALGSWGFLELTWQT